MIFKELFKRKNAKKAKKEQAGQGIGIAAEKAIESMMDYLPGQMTEINDRLHKIESKQKEAIFQLDEISGILNDGGETDVFIEAIISLTDNIENFYRYAAKDADSPLFEQARMMWEGAMDSVALAGIEIIDDKDIPFDFRRHIAEESKNSSNFSQGYVIETIKSGYIFNNEVVRRASVIVNRGDSGGIE